MADLSAEDIAALKTSVFDKPSENKQANNPPNTSQDAPAEPPAQDNKPPATTEPTVTGAPSFDLNAWLKDNLGWETPEAAKEEVTALRQFKSNPPTTQVDPTFTSETGRRWYQYLKEEKEDDLRDALEARRVVKDLDKMNDEQKLKLFIKISNPLFDQDLIDYQYDNKYKLNEADYADDPMKLRMEKTLRLQAMQTDLKSAQAHFDQYKGKIDLPDMFPKPQPDPGYEEFQKLIQQEEDGQRALEDVLSKVKDTDVQIKQGFVDAANKLDFEVSYTPSPEVFSKAKDAAANWLLFINNAFRNPDGSPKTNEMLKRLAIMVDPEAYTAEIIKQTKDATLKAFLADQKGISDAAPRGTQTYVPTEIDRIRQQVFGK